MTADWLEWRQGKIEGGKYALGGGGVFGCYCNCDSTQAQPMRVLRHWWEAIVAATRLHVTVSFCDY